MGKLSPAVHYRCYIYWSKIRWIRRPVLIGRMKSSTFRSKKATVSCVRIAGAPSCRKTKTHPGISRICMALDYGQEDCRDSSLCPIHFDTRVDKWISELPSFDTPTCVIYKFSTFVFNKVVRWDEWNEVGNVYMVQNCSYSVIYLPKIITISWTFDEVLTQTLCAVFWDMEYILLHGQPSPILLYTDSPSQLPDWLLYCVGRLLLSCETVIKARCLFACMRTCDAP